MCRALWWIFFIHYLIKSAYDEQIHNSIRTCDSEIMTQFANDLDGLWTISTNVSKFPLDLTLCSNKQQPWILSIQVRDGITEDSVISGKVNEWRSSWRYLATEQEPTEDNRGQGGDEIQKYLSSAPTRPHAHRATFSLFTKRNERLRTVSLNLRDEGFGDLNAKWRMREKREIVQLDTFDRNLRKIW